VIENLLKRLQECIEKQGGHLAGLIFKTNTTKMPLYSTFIKCVEINQTECFAVITI
jgi:hypothetical protein